ncbi:MAG: TrkH family potassium uptake protein [Leptolyngbyaceae cyanobacterium]
MTISRTICLGFLALIAIGSLLLTLPSASTEVWQWQHVITALFTSTSAVCVTGHAVVDTGTYFSPFGQAVILVLVQIGGLGYMTVTTFLLLLLGRRFGLREKLALQQALDRSELEGAAQILKSIVATTLFFEITGIFLLMLVFYPQYGFDRSLWLSTFHSISAFNNAGFSLFKDNLIGYQSSFLLNLVITGLIIFGGIGYEVIFEFYLWGRDRRSGWRRLSDFSLNFKVAVSTTVILLFGGMLAFLFVESRNPATLSPMDWQTRLLAAWFQSVTPRTAGFNTIDIGKMTTAGLFITIALMFIGGSPGGTAGGIKTTTLRVLTSCTKAILQGKEEVNLYQRQIPLSLILKAVGVLVGSAATVIVMTVLVALCDPELPFVQILFDTVSAFATVGLSTGLTFDANLSDLSKVILAATMYLGRVGVLLLMSAVLGDPKPSFVKFPEENLLVG